MEKKRSIGVTVVGIIMLILSLYSFYLGFEIPKGLFLEWYIIAVEVLIIGAGLLYLVSSVFLFVLKQWTRKTVIYYSTVLLLYFIPFTVVAIFDPGGSGWGRVLAFIFSPYIIFPLFFIFFFTRTSVKKQFMKQYT